MADPGCWYFLEINVAFGVAIFNVTDGSGAPSTGPGFRHAGRVLYEAAAEAFGAAGR